MYLIIENLEFFFKFHYINIQNKLKITWSLGMSRSFSIILKNILDENWMISKEVILIMLTFLYIDKWKTYKD